LGDIALIKMDGMRDLIIKTDSFLLSQGEVELSVAPKMFGVMQGGFFHLAAKGCGTIAICGYGGLMSLQLEHGQECIVEPKHIVAWERCLQFSPTTTDAIPESTLLAKQFCDYLEEKEIPRLFQRMAAHTINFLVNIARQIVYKFRYHVLGQKGVYKITGPGEIYLSSRLKPSFSLFKNE
jgi:uncharacterized protein (AIM24 family)